MKLRIRENKTVAKIAEFTVNRNLICSPTETTCRPNEVHTCILISHVNIVYLFVSENYSLLGLL